LRARDRCRPHGETKGKTNATSGLSTLTKTGVGKEKGRKRNLGGAEKGWEGVAVLSQILWPSHPADIARVRLCAGPPGWGGGVVFDDNGGQVKRENVAHEAAQR